MIKTTNEWGMPTFPTILSEDQSKHYGIVVEQYELLMEGVEENDTILQFPVILGGKAIRKDEIPYHLTLSWAKNDLPEEELIQKVREAIKGLDTSPPSFETWEPAVFGKNKDFYVMVFPKTGKLQKLRSAILPILDDGWGEEHKPHITVEKHLWDKIKDGYMAPEDVGIEFGPLELKRGNKSLARF